MAHWLAIQKFHIDQILCSPAKRTRQTAELLCNGSGINSDTIDYRQELYLANLDTLLTTLHHCSKRCKTVLLIGHNPGLEELLRYLCGDDLPLTKSGKLLTTANIAIVSLANGWHYITPHSSQLVQLMRPKALPPK